MDRMHRARNLLIELEALKQSGGHGSPIGMMIVVSLALQDAEILVREMLTEMQLREGLERRKRLRRAFFVLDKHRAPATGLAAVPRQARALLARFKRPRVQSAAACAKA